MKIVAYTEQALRGLRKHRNVADRLQAKIADLASHGPGNSVTKLVGQEAYRLRVGDFRVIFTEDATTITIQKIAPRGGAYD